MGMMLSMKPSGSRNFAMVVSPFMDLRRKRYINTDLSMTFGVRRNLKKNASSKKRIAKKIHCPRSNNRMDVIMRSDNITKKVTMNTYLTGRPFHSSRIRVILFGTVLFAIYILLHIPTPTILLTRDLPTMQTIPITTNSIMSAKQLICTNIFSSSGRFWMNTVPTAAVKIKAGCMKTTIMKYTNTDFVKSVFVYFIIVVFMQPALIFTAAVGTVFIQYLPTALNMFVQISYLALIILLVAMGIVCIVGKSLVSRSVAGCMWRRIS